MADKRLIADLSVKGFDPGQYVSRAAEGGEEALLELKQRIHILGDKTAQELKKNVYKNYSQFIDTAREISIVEGEMYQLSHMLTEQKGLMASMMEMSLVSDKAVVEEPQKEAEPEINPKEETRRNLAFLLEKVEGCSSVTEVPGRQLIHNGDLTELDIESLTPTQKVHAFLLTDSLMIASWLPNRRGPVRYRFQGLYELDNLAVVNVRDAGPVKNAFKILMFPASKIYQTDSAKSKRQWLDILEETKKKKASRDKQKKEVVLRLAEQQSAASLSKVEEASKTSFVDEEDKTTFVEFETDTLLQEDWLQELPENLDMCIAQRDFEGAVDLVEKVNEHLKESSKSPSLKEFRARIDHRVKQLTEGLMSELQVSPERSLRGGPRAARRAVAQLIRLGKSAQACDLFLKNRSAIIKYNIRQLKFEGATTLYIRCLCDVFFNSLLETSREFLKAFPNHYGCYSAFIVWCKQELELFVKTFKRHVFDGKTSSTTVAECVSISRKHCQELCQSGLDIAYLFEGLISSDLEKTIIEKRDQIKDTIKYRSADDLWRPMNHMSQKDCQKYLDEMASARMDLKDYVYQECFISLTMNSAQFAKSCFQYTEDLLLIYSQEHEALITDSLVQVFSEQIQHIEASLKSDKFKEDQSFILKNALFILEVLMGRIERLYRDFQVNFPPELIAIRENYKHLKAVAKSVKT
ncbi:hypothetical protein ACJMK2_007844 [Sinanodonta woodiana]|uniref:Exocyst complex component 8 n=1 Tax=Sinanodonta woodiana TaxID=1069815 RepID=A0ABD3VJR4_SINWO